MERKLLDFKALSSNADTGELVGYGNVTGNLDRCGDIVEKGAYKNLATFVTDGFGGVAHNWEEPVATIEEAYEDEHGLVVKMLFHSTDDAQEARTIVMERMERGKSVGLSIGYSVVECAWEMRDGEEVRVLKAIELYEVSIVTVPANPAALVTTAKQVGPHDRPTLDAHLEAALATVGEVVQRVGAVKQLRATEGRTLSSERLDQAKALRDALDAILTAKALDDSKYADLSFRTMAARTR